MNSFEKLHINRALQRSTLDASEERAFLKVYAQAVPETSEGRIPGTLWILVFLKRSAWLLIHRHNCNTHPATSMSSRPEFLLYLNIEGKGQLQCGALVLSLRITAFLELMTQITYKAPGDVKVLLDTFLQMEEERLLRNQGLL